MYSQSYYDFLTKTSILKNALKNGTLNDNSWPTRTEKTVKSNKEELYKIITTIEQEFTTECSRNYEYELCSKVEHGSKEINVNIYLIKINEYLKFFPKSVQEEYKKIKLCAATETSLVQKMCSKCVNSPLINFENKLLCEQCGYNETVQQIFYGESKKVSKKDTAEGYFTEWMNILQAKSIVSIPDNIFVSLKEKAGKYCDNDINKLDKIKCVLIRKWLAELSATKFNKFVPCIYRKLTKALGREMLPPQFSISEEQVIYEDWKALVQIYGKKYNATRNTKKTATKKNNNAYYPILIYFIVRKRFEERGESFRDFIHSQSNETFKSRLEAWHETLQETKYYG